MDTQSVGHHSAPHLTQLQWSIWEISFKISISVSFSSPTWKVWNWNKERFIAGLSNTKNRVGAWGWTGSSCSENLPDSRKGFSKAFLKARWGRGGIGCCKLLGIGILCFCSCPHRSGHDVPVNLRSNVILCSETFYLCMNGKVFYPRWSQPWKWYVLYISGYRQHS